jgi:hypothetical protein
MTLDAFARLKLRGRDEAVAAMLAALGYSFPKELYSRLEAYAEADAIRDSKKCVFSRKNGQRR